MADPKISIEKIIKEKGGVLVRQKKHKVYRFPNGQVFTSSATPSCPLAYANALTSLKNLLGVHTPDRGTPGKRRTKSPKTKQRMVVFAAKDSPPQPVATWQEQLTLAALLLSPKQKKGK
jgi:hypothetical protein